MAAILGLFLTMPSSFPYSKEDAPQRTMRERLKDVRRIDVLGAILLLAASLLLTTVLLDISIRHSWSMAVTIVPLIISILCLILFFTWEYSLTRLTIRSEPMFPWHWVYNRPFIAMILSNFLCGMPFNVAVVFIPERLQTVTGTPPLQAGIRLIPYTFGTTIGAIISMVLGKRKVAVVYIMLVGAVLQTIGQTLLSTLPTTTEWPRSAYGYEVLAGVGMGWNYAILQLTTGIIMQGPDLGKPSVHP